MAINIEYFLDKKVAEIQRDEFIDTSNLYDDVADDRLRYIFSVLHYEFNRLIKFMYSKKNFHFNANESRELLKYIKVYKETKEVLKNTGNSFELDQDYDSFLRECGKFLQSSCGSEIPEDLQKIELKEYEPIFSFVEQVEIQTPTEKLQYSLKLIGAGSYAKVYKYHDEFYDQTMVLKRANAGLSEKELGRFKKEYDVMKSLNSPYILKVFKYDSKQNQYYAEYVDLTLHEYIQKNNQKLTINERYNIIMQVLKGFKYIHSKQILHRDISVTNILIKKYDDIVRIKIADFGLVKEKNSNLTSIDSEIKGSLNDESNLSVVGFANYSILHETFALTRLILYILTGKINLDKINDTSIREFVLKGTNGDLEKRYKNVDELTQAFLDLYKRII